MPVQKLPYKIPDGRSAFDVLEIVTAVDEYRRLMIEYRSTSFYRFRRMRRIKRDIRIVQATLAKTYADDDAG